MNGITAIRTALESTGQMVPWFLGDFTDADLLVRPVPGANHAAWQIGNVIGGDVMIVKSQLPDAVYPELPEGFEERYGNKGTSLDDAGFLGRDAFLALFAQVRAATIAALDGLTDADLERPTTGDMAKFAPTLGHVFLLVSNHTLMHVGQFSVIRRKLGKPVLL
jgi:hypothetical protein